MSIKFNNTAIAIRKMQKDLKKQYGVKNYGFLLAFLLDSTNYFIGNQKEADIKDITIYFNGSHASKIDFDNHKFSHPEFED